MQISCKLDVYAQPNYCILVKGFYLARMYPSHRFQSSIHRQIDRLSFELNFKFSRRNFHLQTSIFEIESFKEGNSRRRSAAMFIGRLATVNGIVQAVSGTWVAINSHVSMRSRQRLETPSCKSLLLAHRFVLHSFPVYYLQTAISCLNIEFHFEKGWQHLFHSFL